MEINVMLERKVDERSGNKDGRAWKIGKYLATIVSEKMDEKIVFEVADGDNHRVEVWDALCGKVCKVYFTVRAKLYESRWFNEVRGWGIKELEPKNAA